VYFSVVPSDDWPIAVDARPSSPQRQSSLGTGEARSTDLGDEDEGEQTSYVHEKVQGKRLAGDEPSPKRKKTSSSSCHDEGGVSIGEAAPHQRQRMVVLDSSNDDEMVFPPSDHCDAATTYAC
jgi:hypothetical protein